MSDEDTNVPAPIFGGAIVDMADADRFVAAMEETVDVGARGGDVSYMSFSGKKGGYKIGIDGRTPDENEHFVIAPTMFTVGWLCWKDGRPIARRMSKLGQPPVAQPAEDELGPFSNQKDGWFRARGCTMKSAEHDEQIEFTTNSKSGVAVIQDIQRQVLDRYKAGQACVPVVTLDEEEFEAQGNTNMKPVFDVTHWLTQEELTSLGNGDVDIMDLISGTGEPVTTAAPEPRQRRRL